MNNIVTIVASDKITINSELIEKICNILRLDISAVKQLSAGKAYDFFCPHLSVDIEKDLSRFLSHLQIDVFFLDESFRLSKKLMLSDMDATLIKNECIDEIARYIGKYDEIANITEEAMNGDMLFEGSLEQRVKLLKNVEKSDLAKIYDKYIELNPGVKSTAIQLKKMGVHLSIVSGGFTYFCKRVAQDTGFDDYYANEFIFEDGKLSGNVKSPIFSSESKAEVLDMLMRKHNIDKKEVIAIGDGANDLPFLTKVPFSIGYKAKPVLRKKVKFNIIHSDFTAILFILGLVV
jgi:phosphoserine phosphatase